MSGGLVTSLIARHKLMKIVYNCSSSCSASSLAFWVSAKVYAIACKLFCAILTFVFAVGECQTFLGHFLLDFLFIFLKYRASIVLVSHENHHPISSPSIFSFYYYFFLIIHRALSLFIAGTTLGAYAGAVVGLKSKSSLLHGAAVGAIMGCILSFEIFRKSFVLWDSDDWAIDTFIHFVSSLIAPHYANHFRDGKFELIMP